MKTSAKKKGVIYSKIERTCTKKEHLYHGIQIDDEMSTKLIVKRTLGINIRNIQ